MSIDLAELENKLSVLWIKTNCIYTAVDPLTELSPAYLNWLRHHSTIVCNDIHDIQCDVADLRRETKG